MVSSFQSCQIGQRVEREREMRRVICSLLFTPCCSSLSRDPVLIRGRNLFVYWWVARKQTHGYPWWLVCSLVNGFTRDSQRLKPFISGRKQVGMKFHAGNKNQARRNNENKCKLFFTEIIELRNFTYVILAETSQLLGMSPWEKHSLFFRRQRFHNFSTIRRSFWWIF